MRWVWHERSLFTMVGQNLRKSPTGTLKGAITGKNCVFVSHRQADTEAALAVANYLMNEIGVNVYLDEGDPYLAKAVADQDTAAVVKFIELGLEISTHLLGVISPRTKGSWWVPFEVGSGRQQHKDIAHMLIDDVNDLPEYLKISKAIKDKTELEDWALKLEPTTLKGARRQLNAPNIPGLKLHDYQTLRYR